MTWMERAEKPVEETDPRERIVETFYEVGNFFIFSISYFCDYFSADSTRGQTRRHGMGVTIAR